MYGYIYRTTNLINGKMYIGQKKSEVFLDDKYLGSGHVILKAIKKYGKENFQIELLEWAQDQKDLDTKEILWIEKYNANTSDDYYNISRGGQGGQIVPPHIQTEEEKLKRSESLKQAYKDGRHPVIRAGYPKGKKRTEEDVLANKERNRNKIWIKNSELNIQKTIQKEDLPEYIASGWVQGRLPNSKPAWNKGLSKESDERVAKNSASRIERFKKGESIGCYGVKGNTYGFKKGHEPWNKGIHKSTHQLSQELKDSDR